MKSGFSGLKIKTSSVAQPKSARSTRYMHSTDRITNSKDSNNTFDAGDIRNNHENRLKSFNLFYNQELARISKELDIKEIEIKNAVTPINNYEIYHRYLENLAICVKQKDPVLSNCIFRGITGTNKSHKKLQKSLQLNSLEISKIKEPVKLYRENLTQTYEGPPVTVASPDISKEINYIKGLVKRVSKLKAPKIIQSLYDLHESLCKLHTDIPTPTKTPEPEEITIGTFDQKMTMTLRIIKHEIKKNLKKHNIERIKIDKSIQTDPLNTSLSKDIYLKENEIENLKQNLQQLEKELQYTTDYAKKVE